MSGRGEALPEFITNQRKTLRIPLRCKAQVEVGGERQLGHTEDVSSSGCRLISALRLEPGMTLQLRLDAPGSSTPLDVSALVVWTSTWPGNRHGLAFAVTDRPAARGWFDGLVGKHQELLFHDRVPDRVPFEARIYVAPYRPVQLGVEEEVVLRVACSHPTLHQLRQRLGVDWARAQRALFALLTKGVLTLHASEAGDPSEWVVHLGALARSTRGNRRPN